MRKNGFSEVKTRFASTAPPDAARTASILPESHTDREVSIGGILAEPRPGPMRGVTFSIGGSGTAHSVTIKRAYEVSKECLASRTRKS